MSPSDRRKSLSRRNFLKTAAAVLPAAALTGGDLYVQKKRKKRNKMILSFYMDDTNPVIVKAEAFRYFLDYCNGFGIRGESSIILGYSGKSLAYEPDDNEKVYLWQAKQAWEKGIDSHMEIMTHGELWNFVSSRKNESGIHEGLWLHEPSVTVNEYRDYFVSILEEGARAGIRFTGLTWPGCGCDVCTKRYSELKMTGPLKISNAAFEALLNLARENRFRGRVLPVFYESSETDFNIFRRAAEGEYGVYDIQPNCGDHFGIWENSNDHVDPDYYISEDGKSGILIRHYENNAPYAMWYMHWQGVNPENGKGWKAFQTVNARIRKLMPDKIAWMRPSDIVTAYHDSGGWSFTEKL
jgi:hypothetical protein